jgi:hypothetical protein
MRPQRFGCLPSKRDPRNLQFAAYLKPRAPAPPASCNWGNGVKTWPMDGNDAYGDCVFAALAHLVQEWTFDESGKAVVVPAKQVIAAYLHDSPNDDGANILDTLSEMRKAGLWGRQLTAFAQVDPHNHLHAKQAVYLFGGLDLGLNMPVAWHGKKVWDIGKGNSYRPGSWGGHSVPIIGYTATALIVVSWGALYTLTWAAFDLYCGEAYALLSPDWTAKGKAPSGFDLKALQADLADVTKGKP